MNEVEHTSAAEEEEEEDAYHARVGTVAVQYTAYWGGVKEMSAPGQDTVVMEDAAEESEAKPSCGEKTTSL